MKRPKRRSVKLHSLTLVGPVWSQSMLQAQATFVNRHGSSLLRLRALPLSA